MLIKLINNMGEMILVNPDQVIKVIPAEENGICLKFTSGIPDAIIPNMGVDEFLAKTREGHEDFCKMTSAICNRISHLEEAMTAGLQYIGRSCH